MYVKLVGLSYRTLLSTTPLSELSRVGLYFCYCVIVFQKNVHQRNKMYARRTLSFFPEQECDPVTVLV